MADAPPLPADLVAELRTQPRPFAAAQLLASGRGPLGELDAAFHRDVADVAFFLWLVFGAARRPRGMLSGRPTWEAAETMAARVRAAAPCAGSLAQFGDVLLRRLNLRPEGVLRGEDLVWWRALCATDKSAGIWRRVSTRERLSECVVAMGLLREWMWALRAEETDDAA